MSSIKFPIENELENILVSHSIHLNIGKIRKERIWLLNEQIPSLGSRPLYGTALPQRQTNRKLLNSFPL